MDVELPMPANLLDILAAEKGIMDKTLVGIAANQECQEHLKLISEGIDVIQSVGLQREHKDDEELTLQGIVA